MMNIDFFYAFGRLIILAPVKGLDSVRNLNNNVDIYRV